MHTSLEKPLIGSKPFRNSSSCQRHISGRSSRKLASLELRLQHGQRVILCGATATENASEDLPAELKKLVTNFSMVFTLSLGHLQGPDI